MLPSLRSYKQCSNQPHVPAALVAGKLSRYFFYWSEHKRAGKIQVDSQQSAVYCLPALPDQLRELYGLLSNDYQGLFSLCLKWTKREADHSFLSGVEEEACKLASRLFKPGIAWTTVMLLWVQMCAKSGVTLLPSTRAVMSVTGRSEVWVCGNRGSLTGAGAVQKAEEILSQCYLYATIRYTVCLSYQNSCIYWELILELSHGRMDRHKDEGMCH